MYCIPAFSVMPSDADGKRKVIYEHSIFQNAVNVISHNTLPAKVVEEVYRCNRVYVPWVNRGFRRTQSRWKNVGESILLIHVESMWTRSLIIATERVPPGASPCRR